MNLPDTVPDCAVRGLGDAPGLSETLDRVLAMSRAAVEPCDGAVVSLLERGQLEVAVASHHEVASLERLQLELDEGPAVEALRSARGVCSSDVGVDPRWPRWGPRLVTDGGLRSVLSLPLSTPGQGSFGALTLYARAARAFGDEMVRAASTSSALASTALAQSRRHDQLSRGLENRALIGQATGILMERFALTPERAFSVLLRLSQDQNIKLRHVAAQLIETRVLPGGAEVRTSADRPGRPQ